MSYKEDIIMKQKHVCYLQLVDPFLATLLLTVSSTVFSPCSLVTPTRRRQEYGHLKISEIVSSKFSQISFRSSCVNFNVDDPEILEKTQVNYNDCTQNLRIHLHSKSSRYHMLKQRFLYFSSIIRQKFYCIRLQSYVIC